ncbi:hypothetical protein [Flavobacterium yafengii]|uniref:Uncharacterized protein n=1 Tax=Flavobacterium yafengii TaxID=3041253 RepID=A0AAW6TKT5_9FLAO|nr:hypothetical protein [Flavobacterium yafengii]MDI5950217.1 hypothetical protein [Flavobacterium yafengii]
MLLFATYSCQVEGLEPISIANGSLETTKKVNPTFLKHDLSRYKIKPIWKSALTFENIEAVEVNFTLDKKTYKPLSKDGKINGRQRLLLTFERGKIRETIIEYIPSDSFMGDIKDINSGNFKSKQFDGEVSFKKPKDKYSIVWVLSKGIVAKKLIRTQLVTKNKTTNKSAGYEVCSEHEVLYEVCVGAAGEERCITSTRWVYDCIWVEYDPDPELPPDEDPYDCSVNNSWPWCQDGGGGDPTDPENECSNLESTFDSSYGQSISEDINSVVTFDDSSSRTVRYTWNFYRGYGITLQSVDKGVHNRVGDHWEWGSLTHEYVYQTTDNSLFEVTHTVNNASSIVNSPNTATITINYNVKAVLNCGGIAVKTKEENNTSSSVKSPYADGDQ